MLLDPSNRAVMSLARCKMGDALKRFVLFNNDVEGAGLSFRLFSDLSATHDPANNNAILYHASSFVCAVRRAGRLLESLSANRACFSDPVAEVVRLEWKKKRAFFESFVKARNAIEHIEGEASDKTKWSFFNLHDGRFCVVDGVFVEVNRTSLDTLLSARDAIAEAIVKEYPDPMLGFLDSAVRT